MRELEEAAVRAAVVDEREADVHHAEQGCAELRGGGPGVRATRPGPLARFAARRRVVSADLARFAAALRLAARHDE